MYIIIIMLVSDLCFLGFVTCNHKCTIEEAGTTYKHVLHSSDTDMNISSCSRDS